MNNVLLIAAIALLAFILIKKWMTNSKASQKLKTMNKSSIFLVDVREPSEYASGSVKGAVNIPVGSIAQNLSKFKGKEEIVVFCRSGSRSGMAASVLKQNGIENVTNGGTVGNVQSIWN